MMKIYLHWRDIIEYFDNLISEKDTFLDPERHDNLLSDDESFSRSKKYFWAITTLKELDASVSDNLLQVRRLLDSAAPSSIEKLHIAEFEDARYCLKIRYHELEEVATKLREKRQEATDLRDGLFSASAVMESRAATRLGENVKLLTFVSIFFLPLSFCMSLWSINTLFSLNALAIVTPIVAISTYFVVFNIDSIAHLFRFIYGSVLYNTISSMKRDESNTWKERGRAFERYSSLQRQHNKPSDWRLVQYVIMRPWTLFTGQSKPSNKVAPMESNNDYEKPGLESEGTGLSSLSPSLRLWKRRTMGNQTAVP
ncbi:hypothetical protein B0O99DRAFT_365076 [Bisporella sp. PMI_857]|nr:hypothetical protein B0O99DRAFT_365076 [Bisporella sp. PMI_857]